MSDKIKEAARARQKSTGESYVTARRHVTAAHSGGKQRLVEPLEEVTVITPTEYVFRGRWRKPHLRLDLADGAVRVVLDGNVLGDVPAVLVEGKAHVTNGEYQLADGWGVRVEPDFDEPDPEIGYEGGRTGGEVSLLSPIPAGSPVPHYRPSYVSLTFRRDGSTSGWGGPSETISPCAFVAPGLAPVAVELEHIPKEGDFSAGILDGHRRKVLRVQLMPLANGPTFVVELGEPLPPEQQLRLLFEIHQRTSFAMRPTRGTEAFEESSIRELSPKVFGHFGGEAVVDRLVAAGFVRRATVPVAGLVATRTTREARREGEEVLDYVMITTLGTETLRTLGQLRG